MITYSYVCERGCSFQLKQSIKDDPIQICPECYAACSRVIGLPTVIDKTPKTLGSYAEQNTKRVGKYKIEEDQMQYDARYKQSIFQ